jgi:hypothetical protein
VYRPSSTSLAILHGYAHLALVVYTVDPVDVHLFICLDTAQNDMRDWMRGNFVKALNVDISCVRSVLEVYRTDSVV